MTSALPERAAEWDRWILGRRPPRNRLDPWKPSLFFAEEEVSEAGEIVSVATIFLTNRECPWRCLMCDLWRNTLTETVPLGAIPEQIRSALATLPVARHVKLYNAGSFFDPKAIPPEDYAAVAALLDGFQQVIVECHPALVGDACVRFRDLLTGDLEVALGLETIHPDVLPRLNKKMTPEQFRKAAWFLRANGIAVRSFVLVGLPFVQEEELLPWICRSLEFAFDSGSTAVSLIPTRAGNGAMDELAARGEFARPTLSLLEAATAYGLQRHKGRVFADLWDLERLASCGICFPARRDRLRKMNLSQAMLPRISCADCGGSS